MLMKSGDREREIGNRYDLNQLHSCMKFSRNKLKYINNF